jgi:hypothetical protein
MPKWLSIPQWGQPPGPDGDAPSCPMGRS